MKSVTPKWGLWGKNWGAGSKFPNVKKHPGNGQVLETQVNSRTKRGREWTREESGHGKKLDG